jgi:hypothetical protein
MEAHNILSLKDVFSRDSKRHGPDVSECYDWVSSVRQAPCLATNSLVFAAVMVASPHAHIYIRHSSMIYSTRTSTLTLFFLKDSHARCVWCRPVGTFSTQIVFLTLMAASQLLKHLFSCSLLKPPLSLYQQDSRDHWRWYGAVGPLSNAWNPLTIRVLRSP